MSLLLAKRTFSVIHKNPLTLNCLFSISSNGCHLFISSSSTPIRPIHCQGRLRRQRGVHYRQQLWVLNGSPLSLSSLSQSHLDSRLYCSNCQVSSIMSPPLSLPLLFSLQKEVLASNVSVRSMPLYGNFDVSIDGVMIWGLRTICESFWLLPMFDFVKKIKSFNDIGHCRTFSSCEFEEEKDVYDVIEGDNEEQISEHGFSISDAPTRVIARSMPSYKNDSVSINRVSNCELPTNYVPFWLLPKFDFSRKMMYLKWGGHYRAFSSSDCEEERETDSEVGDNDIEGDRESGEAQKSSVDVEEVSRVAKVIEELFALDRNMEAVLDECGINLTHDLLVDVLERFKHARKPAFRFFSWAGEKPGFSHDSRTYNAMLRILGKTRQLETMGSLLEEMGEKGLLTMESFTIAIKAYASGKERKKAVGVFELMKKYGFKAGVETVNCLLDSLAREKLAKEAQALFDKLKCRFTPNMKTYTALLSGWCRVKNLMEAGKIWNEMIDRGFKPDLVTHNIMLDGLLKVNKRSEAIKLFEVMKAKGPTPNARSYTILMRDFCKHSKMKEAVSYFNEMVGSGCEPDAGVYTCLITGFGNQKKMDMVYGLLKEMKEKGYPPDGQLYNALIKLMTNRRMPDDAVSIYKRMIQSGNQPTIHTYNMMMKSYFVVGNSEMGRAVWDEMVQTGCCPDENSYTVLIGGLIRQGRSLEACKYVEQMIDKGMRIPQLDLDKFIADFSRVGLPNVLEEMARKMRISGKFEVSEVFSRWVEMSQKRRARRDRVDTDS